MFRHVEIKGTFAMEECLIKNWCRHFEEFLEILTRNTQLISVMCRDLEFCVGPRRDKPTNNRMCRAIADFLGSQRHLKRAEGVELIRKLAEHNRQSLKHPVIRQSFDNVHIDKEQALKAAQTLPTFADLTNLTTLGMEYSLIFENMFPRPSNDIQTIKRCQKRVLSKLILNYYCDMEIEDFRGLTSTDWQFLKTLYPDLQVELSISTEYPTLRELEFLIVLNMPISQLDYRNDPFDKEIEINELFDHLLRCRTNDHLVDLQLDWKWPIEDFVSTFNPFLHACRKLKYLKLKIDYSASGIEALLESWLENRPPSLKKVIIDVSNTHDEDDYPTSINCTEYVPLLKLAGLNIRVNFHI
ncbi:hypothetical protein AVEN_110967-1 [Araneus ventricosus]|uniref:F-box domain-containing protein n=1 Tax=Araneus ventricosus TaxID=182803 RepID=A0A4Y2LJY8_ARAVE|nr:hypothetical protein AVEN_110967-1 [Araneus ventricosus]